MTDATSARSSYLVTMTTKYFCMTNSPRVTVKRALLAIPVAILVCYSLHWCMKEDARQELYSQTSFKLTPSSQNASAVVKVQGQPTYILSAIIEADEASSPEPVVIVTAWDNSKDPLNCCILHADNTLHVTKASFLRQFHQKMYFHTIFELFSYASLPARELTCPLVSTPGTATHLALTSGLCTRDSSQYKKIVHAKTHEGELAVCGKVAYNDSLEPERLVEWMEFQRMMGVDKVLLFTMRLNPAVVHVLDYYVKQGFLETVPFELPGKPIRGFRVAERVNPQFSHDEQMAIYDCRHRLSGYSHVAGIDLDEIIIPRSGQPLKEFLQAGVPFYSMFSTAAEWQD